MKSKFNAVAIIVASVFVFAPTMAEARGPSGSGNNTGVWGTFYPQGCAITPEANVPLSENAVATLLFMREEEKLARDVYQFLGNKWGSQVFRNIAASEQTHMDQILNFLQVYGIADPASSQTGVFNDASLQTLYNQLITRGSNSVLAAMQVGALIEEVDIRDLRLAVETTTNISLAQMYLNLTSGSYNHLNAFVGQIAMLGESYTAQLLSANDVSAILSGTGVAGIASAATGVNGKNLPVVTTTCFTPTIQTTTQVYGNGATIAGDEALVVSTRINVDNAMLGVPADLLAVVEYTPANGTGTQLLMRSGESWATWDGSRYTLTSALRVTLTQSLDFQIFQGRLAGLPGQFSISTGYRLDDGTLILARDPIRFGIQ